MQKIDTIEDDQNIRELIVYALTAAGFMTTGFADGEAFYAALYTRIPDLILLDIMLPGENGVDILKKLKASEKTSAIPVIMLTAKSAEYDRIKGLDLGADDYITKPFSVMETIARVRAVLRRSVPDAAPENQHTVGTITMHRDKRSVMVNGAEILLTYKEFELLQYLMHHESIVLSREKILSKVWGFDYYGESRTVDMHIKSLRHKLGEAGNAIKTVRNVGYKIES
ncbi:MAG: response regulator transcription factor [Treponema sp.]|nr:response regulator transcription factor [Treponema sp.]